MSAVHFTLVAKMEIKIQRVTKEVKENLYLLNELWFTS